MGENFHTPWVEDTTGFSATELNDIPSDLDQAITFLKNIIVHYDGDITYSILTGILTWNSTIRIIFTNSDGNSVYNTIAANNITLSDNDFCYVDLNETSGTALTMQKAAITAEAASNTIDYNRLVLGYRNTATDRLFSYCLDTDPDKLIQSKASGDNVSVDWSLGSLATVTLDRATTTFAFDGAREGQVVRLALLQDGTGNRGVAFGGEVRDGTDISLPLVLSAANKLDYVTFIYLDSNYDIIDLVKGIS